MKENKKLYIAFIIFIVLIVSSSITRIMQNDTFFTIATGNYIIENGYDNLDHLTWHENLNFYKLRWGFDVIIALIYNTFSFTGIYIFVLIVACITGIALFNILLKQNCKILVSFIITIFAMLSVISVWGFTARAQIISYLLLLLEVFFIEKLIENKKHIYYIYLFFISVLLVNFHASVWIMLLVLIAPYFFEAILSKLKNNANNNSRIIIKQIDIKALLIATGTILFGSLFSPIGTYPYTYMFKVIGGLSSQFIAELQSVNLFSQIGLSSMLIFFIIIFLELKAKIRFSNLVMFSGLTVMALTAYRNLSFLYIIGSFIIGKYITTFFETYDKYNMLENATKYISRSRVLIIVALFILISCTINYLARTSEPHIDNTSYPVGAVNYIKKYIDYENLKVFNNFDFGSYMELNGIPAFIDSRSEIFCKEFNDTEVLKDWYETVVTKEHHYKKLFEKYNIEYAILYNTEIINIYISEDNNYIKIYSDDYFSIYMKMDLYNQHYIYIPLVYN